jgi:hypothetical protein
LQSNQQVLFPNLFLLHDRLKRQFPSPNEGYVSFGKDDGVICFDFSAGKYITNGMYE